MMKIAELKALNCQNAKLCLSMVMMALQLMPLTQKHAGIGCPCVQVYDFKKWMDVFVHH